MDNASAQSVPLNVHKSCVIMTEPSRNIFRQKFLLPKRARHLDRLCALRNFVFSSIGALRCAMLLADQGTFHCSTGPHSVHGNHSGI